MSGRRVRPTRANKKYTKPKMRQFVKVAYLIERNWPGELPRVEEVMRVFAVTKWVAMDAINTVEMRRPCDEHGGGS